MWLRRLGVWLRRAKVKEVRGGAEKVGSEGDGS